MNKRNLTLVLSAVLVLTGTVPVLAVELSVTITPYNPPIIIPEAGGSFGYHLEARNDEPTSQAFDIWTIYTFPGGGQSVAVFGPVEFRLPAGGWSAQNDLSQYLAGDQPPGTYTYTALAGIYPDVVWGSDSFTFEKLTGSVGWYAQSSGEAHGLTAVWFVDRNSGWTVSSYREILHSTNGGDTWQPQDDGRLYPHEYNDVFFVDAQTGWVVGHGWSLGGTILKTTDAGDGWIEQDHESDDRLNSVFFVDADNGWVAGGDLDFFGSNHHRFIEHTADGGLTWHEQHWQSYRYPLQSVHSANTNHGWAVGGPGYILHTSNGGDTWSEQSSGTVSYLEGVFFIDENEGWCVGAGGTVRHTTDGGATWHAQDTGTTAEFKAVFFVDFNNGWIVGADYDLYRAVIMHTTDGGDSWQAQDPGTGVAEVTLRDVHFVDADHGWAAGDSFHDIPVMLHTENGGSILLPQPLFADGFESGDTSAWSHTVP